MTTHILSHRAKTIFARLADVDMEAMLLEAKALDKEGLLHRLERENERFVRCGEWGFGLDLLLPRHDESCELFDEGCLPLGGTCEHCEEEKERWWMGLYLFSNGGRRLIEKHTISVMGDDKHLVALGWIVGLSKEWKICLCGAEKAIRGDFCRRCYLHSYKRTEEEGGDCCVCHENNGRWTKLECGHILHSYCWDKVLECGGRRNCPLCRKESLIPSRDPYDK
jgi:hypothetical protein